MCVCINFCIEGKTATETHEILKIAYSEVSMSRTQIFDWFGRFKNSRRSVDDQATIKEHIAEGDVFVQNVKKQFMIFAIKLE